MADWGGNDGPDRPEGTERGDARRRGRAGANDLSGRRDPRDPRGVGGRDMRDVRGPGGLAANGPGGPGGDMRDPRTGYRGGAREAMPDLGALGDLLGQGAAAALAGALGGRLGAASGERANTSPEVGPPRVGGSEAAAFEAVELRGEARQVGPGSAPAPAVVRIDSAGLTLEVGGARPIHAGYRDLSLIAVQQGTALLVLGEGPDAMRWLLERFGDHLGPLVRDLRERRLRQQLADALVKVPDDPFEMLEFAWRPAERADVEARGVGQFVVHSWGFVLVPLDEREAAVRFRRGAIRRVDIPEPGTVRIDGDPGRLELRGVGAAAERLRDRLGRLRDGAYDDAARLVEELLPDAPFAVRHRAETLLVDGRPTRPDELGEGWPLVEAAVLGVPAFAESYASLVAAAGPGAPRWLAMSPADPGSPESKIWFFVALPGNLLAMELVSEGAHATYCFRVVPRASYAGELPAAYAGAGEAAVRAISEALLDTRFLREPIALPADQLRQPKYLRYRLAIAALPSLADARARFVGRIVHSSADRWNAAIQDLIAWHSSAGDDAAEWPGRAVQEAQVESASGEGPASDDAGRSQDAADPTPGR